MNLRTAFATGVLVVVASACTDSEELAALNARLSRDEVVLVEKQSIAQNLNEYRREMDRMEKKIAEANVPAQWDASDAMVRVNRAASGSVQGFTPGEKGAHVVLGASNGPEGLALAITGVQTELPTAQLRSVELHDRAWKMEFDLEKPEAFTPHATQAAPLPPLPPETWRTGEEAKQLRRRVTETEARITELDKVLGEVENISTTRAHLEQLLSKLEEPGRAKRALPLVSSVLEVRPALITDGVATFADGALRVQVTKGRKAAEWGDALAGKAKVVAFSDGPPITVELVSIRKAPPPGSDAARTP